MAGAAVIINEFGEIGLDHLLLATPSENTVILDSGCICCTLRGDLVDTLRNLDKQRVRGEVPPFDRVLIETTGLADPVPIVQTIVTDARLAPAYVLDSVITLVDGVNGLAQLESQPESVKQAAIADRLLITKIDLPQAQPDTLTARLAEMNPGAIISHIVHGAVQPADLFGAGIEAEARAADFQRWLGAEAFTRVEAHQRSLVTHAKSTPDASIRAYSITLDTPVTAAGLTAWLTAVASLRGAALLRVKGLLNIDGQPVAVHAVQTLIHEPITLARWPDDERRSRLVFITRGMARTDIEATLGVLGWQSASQTAPAKMLDPQAYARFVTAMTKTP